MLLRSVGEMCCREVLEKGVAEMCCREVLEKSAGEECGREVLEKRCAFVFLWWWLCFCGGVFCGGAFVARRVGEEGCRQVSEKVLEKSVVEEVCREALEKRAGMCCREVLGKGWRRVLKKRVVKKCWRRVL